VNPIYVYLWQQADTICVSLYIATTSVIGIGAIMAGPIAGKTNDKSEAVSLSRTGKRLLALGCIFGLFSALMPKSDAVALIYVIPRIAESQAVQQDLPEVYKMAIKKLKETLK